MKSICKNCGFSDEIVGKNRLSYYDLIKIRELFETEKQRTKNQYFATYLHGSEESRTYLMHLSRLHLYDLVLFITDTVLER